jgi:hypothetical protein
MTKFRFGRAPQTILTDSEVAALITERKVLPVGWQPHWTPRPQESKRTLDLDVARESGGHFHLFARQSLIHGDDFSVGLLFIDKSRYIDLMLRRYNGPHYPHANRLENEPVFADYHIHEATERYQRRVGYRNEGYAVRTTRFGDVDGALQCLLKDCGFVAHPDSPLSLFGPGAT